MRVTSSDNLNIRNLLYKGFLKATILPSPSRPKKLTHFKGQPRQSLVCPEYVNQLPTVSSQNTSIERGVSKSQIVGPIHLTREYYHH